MKKTAHLIFALIAVTALSGAAFAAVNGSFNLSAGSYSNGGTFTADIVLTPTQAHTMSGINAYVYYDSTKVEVTNIQDNYPTGWNSSQAVNEAANSRVNYTKLASVAGSPLQNISSPITLYRITFRVLPGAVAGASTLTLGDPTTGNFFRVLNGITNITGTRSPGNITISANQAPTAPVLTLPVDGAIGAALTPTFNWNASTDPDGGSVAYTLAVSTNSNLSSPVVNQAAISGTSYTLTSSLSNNTLYYWRVSVRDDEGMDVNSTARSFTTIAAAPGASTITSIAWNTTDTDPVALLQKQTNANFTYGVLNINSASEFGGSASGSSEVPANSYVEVRPFGSSAYVRTPIYWWQRDQVQTGISDEVTPAGTFEVRVVANGVTSANTRTEILRPRLYSITPTSGTVGSTVTVDGRAFGTTAGNIRVLFNGIEATPTVASNTSLTVAVPSNATTGTVTVRVNGQTSNNQYVNENSQGYGNPVNFTVSAAPASNNPPVAVNGSASTAKNTAAAITLSATDADGNPLTYWIVANPANGTLGAVSGNPATYTPNNNYVGADSFTFKANDGTAESNTATISITVTDVATPPASTAPSIGAIAPTSANIGQTIVISGANFGATKGTSSITIGGMTANPTAWSASSITLAVPSGVTAGAANVAVTVSGQTANSSITIDGSKIVIDDIEGGSVGTWTIDNDNSGSADSGYYTFDDGMMAPTNNNITSQGPDASAARNGTKGMKVKFSYVQNADPAKDWGDGWGAALSKTLDLSAMQQITMSIKWDGSSNAVKLSFQDSGRHIYAATVSNATLAAVSGYGQISLPLSDFAEDTSNSARTAGAINWSQITNYNIAYLNKGTTANYQNIDDITALSTTETTTPPPAPTATGEAPAITTVTPAQSPAGIRIAVSGARFGSTQGSSTLIFENTSTHVAYPAEIISWSDTSIEAIAPRLATAGNYTIKVNRVANAAGAVTALESNPAAFQVTASAAVETATLYPNPFNPNAQAMTLAITNTGGATNIGFYIYDMTAKLVFKRVITASTQTTWNGRDIYDGLVADGAYILRVVNEDTKTLLAKGKILVVKR